MISTWVQARLPAMGSVNLDPTNNVIAGVEDLAPSVYWGVLRRDRCRIWLHLENFTKKG